MQDAQASYALIGGQGAGIGTRRALLRALAAGVDPETRLSTIAAAESVTVDGETSIVGAACEMLRQDVPHVAVAFRGEPVGILTLREVMAVLLEVFDTEDWMRALRVAVVSPSGPSLTLRPV
jgi:CBS domain-containing protein